MRFICTYGTPEGRVLTEVRDGSDAETVRRALERRGFHIFKIRPQALPFKLSLSWSFGKIPDDELMAFNQELAALLHAGLPLFQSLELVLESMEHQKFRGVLSDIHDQVASGEELSQAFAS